VELDSGCDQWSAISIVSQKSLTSLKADSKHGYGSIMNGMRPEEGNDQRIRM